MQLSAEKIRMTSAPNSNKHELGSGVVVGLVVGGIISAVIEAAGFSFPPVGALVGGACAAYIIRNKLNVSVEAGALSGLLSLPFYLGVSYILLVFGVIPIATGSQPSLPEIQNQVLLVTVLDLMAGAIGGMVLGAVRRPTVTPPVTVPGTIQAGQAKYCVQCGAQLPVGGPTCPHCGAKQPS